MDPKMLLVLFQKVSELSKLQNVTIYHKKMQYVQLNVSAVGLCSQEIPRVPETFLNPEN